jgi:hypothetical protein
VVKYIIHKSYRTHLVVLKRTQELHLTSLEIELHKFCYAIKLRRRNFLWGARRKIDWDELGYAFSMKNEKKPSNTKTKSARSNFSWLSSRFCVHLYLCRAKNQGPALSGKKGTPGLRVCDIFLSPLKKIHINYVIVLDQWTLLSFSPAQEYYWVKLFTLLGWAPTLQGPTLEASTF